MLFSSQLAARYWIGPEPLATRKLGRNGQVDGKRPNRPLGLSLSNHRSEGRVADEPSSVSAFC